MNNVQMLADVLDVETETMNNTFINMLWISLEPSEIIMKTSLLLPVVLWGILSNLCLIVVIIKHKHLHSVVNIFIANMAIADMCSLLIHPWVYLINNFFQNYELGEFICLTEGALEISLLLANILSLSAISYLRVTAIASPHDSAMRKKKAMIVIALFWLLSFALASPLVIFRSYKERQWIDFTEKYCRENHTVLSIYWHVIITMLVWLPLLIMIICYVVIFIKLYKYEKKVKVYTKLMKQLKYRSRVAKISFVVIVTFLLCRLPFTSLIFYRNSLHKKTRSTSVLNQVAGKYETLWFVSKFLIFVNAGINPIIYGIMNAKFRRAFSTTTISKWFFVEETSSENKCCNAANKNNNIVRKDPQQPPTKETITESNKNRIFSLFRTTFQHKQKEVTICEKNNEIINI